MQRGATESNGALIHMHHASGFYVEHHSSYISIVASGHEPAQHGPSEDPWGLSSNGTEMPFHGRNTLNCGRLVAMRRNVEKSQGTKALRASLCRCGRAILLFE